MSLRVRFVGGLLALAAIGFLWAPASSMAAGTVACDFSNHTLAVTATDAFTRLARDGNAITVDDGIHPPTSCTGGNANINNTDLITVAHTGSNANMIDLKGGPFEPGLATEPSGLAEIEIQYLARSYVDIRGSASAEHLGLGAGGVDLNGDGDVDVTGDFSTILLEGQGGDDVIGPVPGYTGTSGRRILNGGPGNDTIRSTPDGSVIHGGDGNDRLIGGRKGDNLTGGTGEDVIKGGKGPDLIRAIDSDRDIVNCGGGFDRIKQDGIDKTKNCEKILRVKRSEPVRGKK
jgi:Ca2+-binding RTX toxin-like protein